MADGQAPDQTQALLQMQSLIASSRGGNGGSPLLAAILPSGGRDVDACTGFSCKGKGLNSDGMINKLPQAKSKLIDSLMKQVGLSGSSILEDCKKAAQGVQAVYTGDLPSGSLPSADGGGMSFSAMVSSRGMDDGGGLSA